MCDMFRRTCNIYCHVKSGLLQPSCYAVGVKCGMAKTVLGAISMKGKLLAGTVEKKKRLPVETDPEKLVNYVCGSNIYKEGEDVKLGDDSEYPDWLWKLRLGLPPPLEEMDPNTKEYWERYFELERFRKLRLLKTKMQVKKYVNKPRNEDKVKKLYYRALAYKYFDAGYDSPPHFDRNRVKFR